MFSGASSPNATLGGVDASGFGIYKRGYLKKLSKHLGRLGLLLLRFFYFLNYVLFFFLLFVVVFV